MANNILLRKIEIFLMPLLGEVMAKATLKVQCDKMGFAPESLTFLHLPQLAKRIENALIIFIGSEKAKEVSGDILKISL